MLRFIGEGKDNENVMSSLVLCLHEVVWNNNLRWLLREEHYQELWNHLLPMC